MKYQTLLATLLLASSAAAAAAGKDSGKGAKDAAQKQQQQQQQQQQQGQGQGNQAGGKNNKGKGGNNNNNSASQSAAAASASQTDANGAAASASSASGAAATDAAAAGGNGGLALDAANVQKASQQDGSKEGGAAKGQAASQTDNANFINFCSGKTKTNGVQFAGGSCNGIVMGDIPSQDNMVSGIITSPQAMEDLPANQDITMVANYKGITLGTFTNPDVTYYAAPQQVGKDGKIIGHTHFTVQNMNNQANPKAALDPVQFDFFKGVDGPADNAGNVAVTINGGLPAGTYRVCLMSSAANHQAVTMPVAQRGAQDDCQRFTVGQGKGGAAASSAAAGGAAATDAAAAGGNSASASSADAAQATNGNNGKQNGKGKQQGGQNAKQGGQNAKQGGQKGQKGQKQQGKGQQKRFGRHSSRQF